MDYLLVLVVTLHAADVILSLHIGALCHGLSDDAQPEKTHNIQKQLLRSASSRVVSNPSPHARTHKSPTLHYYTPHYGDDTVYQYVSLRLYY